MPQNGVACCVHFGLRSLVRCLLKDVRLSSMEGWVMVFMLCKGYMQYTQGNKYFNWQQQEDIVKDGKNNDLPHGCVSLYPPYAVHSFAHKQVCKHLSKSFEGVEVA